MTSADRRNAVNVYITPVTIDNYSRNDYLKWVNDMLQMRLTKIEQLSTGEVYCQFMEMLFPGCCPCSKIIFNPTMEVEYTQNFRYLQNAFRFIKVDKVVPIDRLIKGKYMDNFDFLQWFRKFVDANYSGEPYDALAARGGIEVPKTASTNRSGAKLTSTSSLEGPGTPKKTALVSPITRQYHHTGKVVSYNKSHSNAGAKPSSRPSSSAVNGQNGGARGATNGSSSNASLSSAKRKPISRRPTSSSSSSPAHGAASTTAALAASHATKLAELNGKLSDLKVGRQELEKERDFYMSKLSEIETICQNHNSVNEKEDEEENAEKEKTPLEDLVDAVLEIMYATEEEFADGDDVEGEEEEEPLPEKELAASNDSDEEY